MKKKKAPTDSVNLAVKNNFNPGILLEEIDDPAIVLDYRFSVRFVNRACLQFLGYDAAELLDMPFSSVLREDEEAKARAALSDCLSGANSRREFACELTGKDGTAKSCRIKAVSGQLTAGETHLVLRLKSAPVTRADTIENENFNTVVRSAPNPIFIQTDGKFAYLNHAACAFFGIGTPEALIDTPVLDRVDPEFWVAARERIRRLNEDRASVTEIVEQKFLRMDGSSVWAQTKGEPIVYKGRNSALVFAHSTTRRRVAEEALQESEKKYATLFNEANLPILLVKFPELTIVEVNDAWTAALGFSRDEVLGKRTDDLGITRYDDSIERLTDELERSGAVSDVELNITTKTGEERTVLSNINVLSFDNERIALITNLDITERKKAAQKLFEISEKFQNFFDFSPLGAVQTGLDGKLLNVNRKMCEMFGCPKEELEGKSISDITYPDDIAVSNEMIRIMLAGEVKSVFFEKRYVRADGEVFWASATSTVLLDQSGRPMYFITKIRDIAQEKQAEKALRESEERFRAVQENTPDRFMILKPYCDYQGEIIDFVYVYQNVQGAKLTGRTAAELVGHRLTEVFPAFAQTRFFTQCKQAAETGKALEFEEQYIGDGMDEWFHATVTPLPDGIAVATQIITERKLAEEKLREISEKFRKSFDNSAIGMAMTGADGTIYTANGMLCEQFGYPKEALEGRSFLKMTHPDDVEFTLRNIAKMTSGEADFASYEKRFIRADGEVFWANVTSSRLRDMGDSPAQYINQIQDVTERKHTEQLLFESNERYHKSFEYSALPMCLIGLDGQILNVNANMCKVFGYSRDELISLSFGDLLHSEHGRLPPNVRNKLLSNEVSSASTEQLYVKKDRTTFWVHVTTAVIRDMNDKPLYFISQLQDVTERKKMLEELQAREAFSRAIMDNLPIGIAVNSYEPPLVFEYMNDNFPKIYRTTREALTNADAFFEAVYEDPDFREEIRKRVLDGMQSGEPERMRWENVPITRQGAETRFITAYNAMVPGRDMHISIVTDETDRVRAAETIEKYTTKLEEMISERTAQLQEAIEELEAFTYSVSHDLRSPLRTMNGFVRILLEDYADQLDSEGKRICQVIGNGAQNMGRLIDDLLSLSRVSRSSMVRMPVDMEAMVKNLYLELTTEYQRERIDFSVGPLPKAGADPTLIRQVWMNLLDNAVKFTAKKPRARIEVTGNDTGSEIVYAVSDNGAGFDMKYQDKLFGVFQRLHSVNEFEGTGVGLAVVQRIVRRHGGRIWAHGEENVGATFNFSILKEDSSGGTGNS